MGGDRVAGGPARSDGLVGWSGRKRKSTACSEIRRLRNRPVHGNGERRAATRRAREARELIAAIGARTYRWLRPRVVPTAGRADIPIGGRANGGGQLILRCEVLGVGRADGGGDRVRRAGGAVGPIGKGQLGDA